MNFNEAIYLICSLENIVFYWFPFSISSFSKMYGDVTMVFLSSQEPVTNQCPLAMAFCTLKPHISFVSGSTVLSDCSRSSIWVVSLYFILNISLAGPQESCLRSNHAPVDFVMHGHRCLYYVFRGLCDKNFVDTSY